MTFLSTMHYASQTTKLSRSSECEIRSLTIQFTSSLLNPGMSIRSLKVSSSSITSQGLRKLAETGVEVVVGVLTKGTSKRRSTVSSICFKLLLEKNGSQISAYQGKKHQEYSEQKNFTISTSPQRTMNSRH